MRRRECREATRIALVFVHFVCMVNMFYVREMEEKAPISHVVAKDVEQRQNFSLRPTHSILPLGLLEYS